MGQEVDGVVGGMDKQGKSSQGGVVKVTLKREEVLDRANEVRRELQEPGGDCSHPGRLEIMFQGVLRV